MTTVLDKIVATTRQTVEQAKAARDENELRAMLRDAPPPRDFFDALARHDDQVSLIAEVKKASPSQGLIRADFDPVDIAKTYETAGATCLSVLTDEPYFQGSIDYLRRVRQAVQLPVLRKDFVLDSYQVVEARAAGADAVLLIAECLDDCYLRRLHNEIIDLGMTPLVEFYEPENLSRVLDAGADLVGVNNRNLKTMQVDIQHTIRMRQQIPADCLVVGESGIESADDVARLRSANVDAMLVGTSLMKQPDIAAAVRTLLAGQRS